MYMDGGMIKVEGRMVGQNLDMARHFKLGMDMSIYVKPFYRAALEPEFKWAFDAAKAREGKTDPAKDPRFKGKGRMVGGPAGTSGSGSGLPEGGVDPRLNEILKGLRKVEEDEKQSDKVMVRLQLDIARRCLRS